MSGRETGWDRLADGSSWDNGEEGEKRSKGSWIKLVADREGVHVEEMRQRVHAAVAAGQPCPVCGQVHARAKLITVGPMAGTKKDEWTRTCSGHKADGSACMVFPVHKGFVCNRHGGNLPQVRAAARVREGMNAIREELTHLGGQLDVDPAEAMLSMVKEAAWNVCYLRSLVKMLKPAVDDGAGNFVVDEEGVTRLSATFVGAGIGVRQSPDDWKADYHVLVKYYNEERDRLVRYAKLCRDAGVQERQVKIAEAQGEWLAATIDKVLEHIGLTPEQQERLPAIMGRVVDELELANERES